MALSISVILPTHDRPVSLGRTVESILAQTRRPTELIVIDDGVRPVAADVLAAVRAAGVSLRYERRDTASVTASRNRGIELAEGDIIVFTEDDVTWPAEFLERLSGLYEADPGCIVAGIGARVVEPQARRWNHRVWEALSAALGQGRWMPRRWASRYVQLPRRLRGRLIPARRLGGGALSLRSSIAKAERFEESFGGYGIACDREYVFRVGRLCALYEAADLVVTHRPGSTGGRPAMYDRGKSYVANSLYIARHSTDRGAGTALLVGYDLAGVLLLYGAWGLATLDRRKLAFAAGVAVELLATAARAVGFGQVRCAPSVSFE